MANGLDEERDAISEGKETGVIAKKIPVKVGVGSLIFEILLRVLLIVPGLVFLIKKIKAAQYFRQLEQKLQHDASQIDNYIEQRVVILQNTASLVNRSIKFDQDTMTAIAAYRAGTAEAEEARSEVSSKLDGMFSALNLVVERYPELRAHEAIQEAMRQNAYLQREITAARELYNDTVNQWNRDIQIWPTKMIVAAKQGYTTRIPFATTREVKALAKGDFFAEPSSSLVTVVDPKA